MVGWAASLVLVTALLPSPTRPRKPKVQAPKPQQVLQAERHVECALERAPPSAGAAIWRAHDPVYGGEVCALNQTARSILRDRLRWESSATGALYHADMGVAGDERVALFSRFAPERQRRPAPDHTWVSVFRRSERFPEGVGGFGCWFFYLTEPWARGTGMVVDVGRSLVFKRRADAVVWCRRDANCSDQPGGLWASPDKRDAHGYDRIQLDMGWAHKARLLGYDSVQLVWGQFGYPELIVARDACMTQRTPLIACAPRGLVHAIAPTLDPNDAASASGRSACACQDGKAGPRARNGEYLLNCGRMHNLRA